MSATRLLVIVGFLAAIGLVAVLEFASRRERSRIPSLGDVCAFVMQYEVGRVPVGRIGLFGFWWWVGWHFFAR
ncbi:hypothetical protein SAMN05444365_102516 [Micromonospora pattaloongensis]|uniref:Uncharacterized protein n=1 Tax=Micromonospora pattaloongensis TaxID=405436 RepID=A0A1H3KIU0_9ACTN|nr:DUF6186 family protein [Micromonospora pattaloongensis]SDY52043.1 hypothetical protein SAMN05444365_102516 [Micromonospora pattaloongensis]